MALKRHRNFGLSVLREWMLVKVNSKDKPFEER
jgi:hypothetical protein